MRSETFHDSMMVFCRSVASDVAVLPLQQGAAAMDCSKCHALSASTGNAYWIYDSGDPSPHPLCSQNVCPFGSYLSNCKIDGSGTCSPCTTTSCPDGQIELTPCSLIADRVCAYQADIHQLDVLRAFYNATNGYFWGSRVSPAWLDYTISPCLWSGVHCKNNGGQVTSMVMR